MIFKWINAKHHKQKGILKKNSEELLKKIIIKAINTEKYKIF